MPAQTNHQPEALCTRGHEYISVEGAQTEQRGPNTFALNVKCPICQKLFKRMAIRISDGLGYLPEHHTQQWHAAQTTHTPKTHSVTPDGSAVAPQNANAKISTLEANELLIQAVTAQTEQNAAPSKRTRKSKATPETETA